MTDKRKTKPAHKPTEQSLAEVRALSTFGVPQSEIADYLGIDPKTMRKHYRPELDESRLKVKARVGSFIVNAATGAALSQEKGATFGDCLRAAIFYGKTQMGLAEARYDPTEKEADAVGSIIEIIRAARPD